MLSNQFLQVTRVVSAAKSLKSKLTYHQTSAHVPSMRTWEPLDTSMSILGVQVVRLTSHWGES